jgi:gag-polyprotein putative aspartyl protease
VQGKTGRVLVDSGASCNVISAAMVQRLGLQATPLTPGPRIQLANGDEIEHQGSVSVSVSIQGIRFPSVLCTVVDILSEWDLILGEHWLRRTRAVLSYGTKTVEGYTRKGRPFKLQCKEDEPLASSACTDLDRLVISVVHAKRFAPKGCKTFFTTVTKILDSDA